MTVKYFALLTNLGAAKLANAAALGTQLQITQMAVGDGGGALPTPSPAQTQLIAEKRRAALNSLSIDAANSSQIIAEQVIPETDGGWWIREVGLFDKDGVLIAIANCPETYKPQLQEGSGRTQTVRMVLIVSSTEAVTLKIDPSVVLATRKYVDDKVIEVKTYADDLLAEHVKSRNHPDASKTEKGFVKLSSATTSDSETLAATPKAIKTISDATLKTANNLSEIKTAGAAAVAAALENLGLGDVAHLPQLTGIVGTSRNAKMSIAAASATATFTADELIVQTALGGLQYKLSSFSKTINLATNGAGGMDTGTVPVSGFVAIYAIYNPSTQISALLAVNTTSVLAPEVYGGANMPSGYTASALVSVSPIASSKFKVSYLIGRKVSFPQVQVVAASATMPALTTVSIALAAPLNAITALGNSKVGGGSTAAASFSSMYIASDSLGTGYQEVRLGVNAGNGVDMAGNFSIDIITPQTLYYRFESDMTGSKAGSILISSYSF
ncbi:phage tail protein [Yersinia sp. 2540 StPb PI]|uniref:phage tail protein n=1 Tax=Yersinia sp. 2540 StPb PI TaxID=3117406 RepID=UPI003FA42356